MSTDATSDDRGHHPDGFAEFTEELRLLAEVLLARVEPVLRRTAADGRSDLGGCSWCPVCAAAALIRGEHHDVVAALADHGTSMVTVLREALAGVPVEPVLPPEWAEYAAAHHHSWFGGDPAGDAARASGATDAHDPATGHAPGTRATTSTHGPAGAHDPTTAHHPAGTHGTQAAAHNLADLDDPAGSHLATSAPGSSNTDGPTDAHGSANAAGSAEGRVHGGAETRSGRSGAADPASTGTADPASGRASGRRGARWGSARREGAPRPRRVDEFTSTHAPGTDTRPDIGLIPPQPADAAANTDGSRSTRAPRSRYVDIPVTIRG